MNLIRILIADDHHLLLDGISSLLSSEKDMQVADCVTTGTQVLELIMKKDYDVCLLDISMPELDGIATARLIKERKPEIKIIILTSYNDRQIVEEMLEIGVSGYLLKNSTKQELTGAIRKVVNGGLYFSDEVHQTLMQNYVKLTRDRIQSKTIQLTHRELEILQLLAQEYTNDRIAEHLNISFRTVETHRKNLLQKTSSHNLAGLLKYAYNNHLIQ
jgi:DNA-binding NarL/FixJ family response regulator